MKVQFFLLSGAMVAWEVPADVVANGFNFGGFAKTIRADGYFMSPDAYIPHEHIVMIGLASNNPNVVMLNESGPKQ